MANVTGVTKTMKPPLQKSPDTSTGRSKRSSTGGSDAESLREGETSKASVKVTSSTRLQGVTSSVRLQGMTTNDFTDENEYLKGRIEEQAKAIAMLRQKEVDMNQVSLVQSKDEFKKRNNDLIEENLRLQKENAMLQEKSNRLFSAELETRKQRIHDLEKRSAQLIAEYDAMQIKFREIETAVSRKDFGFTSELAKEKEKLKELQTKIDRVMGQLQLLSKLRNKGDSLTKNADSYVKERNETLDYIMDRGKDIQDRQTENFVLYQQAEQLEQIVTKLQNDIAKTKAQ